jgi:phosphate starvation-inducible PhoH-like protein
MAKPQTKKKTAYNFQTHLNEIKLSENQKVFSESILQNNITFCTGPAGTSKTFTTLYTALKLLTKGEIRKIIFTKPIQESGEKLGYLPGNIDEKIAPYLESYMLTLQKMIPEEMVKMLFEYKVIEFRPLAFMRGATFDETLMVLDEAQNTIESQLILYLTRMGDNSKVVVMGDTNQIDIKHSDSAFEAFIEMITDVDGVCHHQFGRTDIVRNKMLIEITDRYDRWKITQAQKKINGNGNGNGHGNGNGNGNGHSNGK